MCVMSADVDTAVLGAGNAYLTMDVRPYWIRREREMVNMLMESGDLYVRV